MRKENEIASPSSCLNKAEPGEMMFVLLARDVAAPGAIRFWCARRVALGKNEIIDPQIVEALDCARVMETERATRRAKKGLTSGVRSRYPARDRS